MRLESDNRQNLAQSGTFASKNFRSAWPYSHISNLINFFAILLYLPTSRASPKSDVKTYLADIIPKIQRFSKQLDNLTLLTNQHWVVIDGILEGKSVYIFRPNGELLISTNGEVEKARWELLGQNSILVDMKHKSYLFKHGFFDENVLALKIDGREEYAFLLNENRYSGELNTSEHVIDYLSSSYLSTDAKRLLISRDDNESTNTAAPEAVNNISTDYEVNAFDEYMESVVEKGLKKYDYIFLAVVIIAIAYAILIKM